MTTVRGCLVPALVTACLGVAGCTYAPESVGPAADRRRFPVTEEYRIGPADVLQISVWKNETLSRTVPVRPDGMISLPLINDVQVAGLTSAQLRDILKKKLTAYLSNPEVSVIVMEMRSFTVSVLGEVKTAGRYQFASRVTVLDVLARAGGITEFASPSDILVLRPAGNAMTRIPFNFRKVIAAPERNGNFFIQPGDIIVVP